MIWDITTSGEMQDIEKEALIYQSTLQKTLEYSTLKSDEEITERNPYEHKHEDGVINPEDDVIYMFTAAIAKDLQGFYDSFTHDALYTAFPVQARMKEEMEEYFQIITANGRLKDIGLLKSEVINPDPIHMLVRINIVLHYDGLPRKNVKIDVQKFSDEHGGLSWSAITPVTEIVNQLKEE